MDTVIDTVRRHIESWNTRDNEVIAETIAFPLVQFGDDGSMDVYGRPEELFEFSELDRFSTRLADAEVVSAGPAVTVVKLAFHWEYPDRGFDGVGNAVWGLEDREGTFFLRWRQFVGWQSGKP